jgi:Flp pilus assembly protein TadD
MGREEEARTALVAAASSHSTPFSLVALADLEMARGDLDRAERYLRRARRIDRDEPMVYEAFARLADHRSDHEDADRFRHRAEVLRMSNPTGPGPGPSRLDGGSSS